MDVADDVRPRQAQQIVAPAQVDRVIDARMQGGAEAQLSGRAHAASANVLGSPRSARPPGETRSERGFAWNRAAPEW